MEKLYETPCGAIRYWVSGAKTNSGPELVFLPGLTADHRLFARQVDWFSKRFWVLAWDPPGHGASWPFALDFRLTDVAAWLEEILRREGMDAPVIVGQSMGGYVGQAYAARYPEKLRGLVVLDSAPLQRRYCSGPELWLLRHMEPVYRHCPWQWLLRWGTKGVSVTESGRKLMGDMMRTYDGQKERYARLCGHGLRMLADAMEENLLPDRLPCPTLLLCGEKDRAGSCIRYNRAWHRRTGLPLLWIPDAGHNANTDQPEMVNLLLARFVQRLRGSAGDGHEP